MSSKRDYYKVLQVGRDASPRDIDRAFRWLARQYQPEERQTTGFRELIEAHIVLSDPEKRSAYDQHGHEAFKGVGPLARPPIEVNFDDPSATTEFFKALFDDLAQRPAPTQSQRRGQDLLHRLSLDFEEAIFGAERRITVVRVETCHTCKGTGAGTGCVTYTCKTCQGSGQVQNIRQTFLGQIVEHKYCPACLGRGEVASSACPTCDGDGLIRQKRRLTVNIPAGVEPGMKVRVRGEGNHGIRGGPPGDLYIAVSIHPHRIFRREGYDLAITLPVDKPKSALGYAVNVPTLTTMGISETVLTIPPDARSGDILVLKGRGIPRLRPDGSHSGYGDLKVKIEFQRGFSKRGLDWLRNK